MLAVSRGFELGRYGMETRKTGRWGWVNKRSLFNLGPPELIFQLMVWDGMDGGIHWNIHGDVPAARG